MKTYQKRCEPDTLLDPETLVQVKGRRGKVLSNQWTEDQFGNRICLHLIKFTERAERKYIGRGVMATVWEKIEIPEIENVNYSFIYTD